MEEYVNLVTMWPLLFVMLVCCIVGILCRMIVSFKCARIVHKVKCYRGGIVDNDLENFMACAKAAGISVGILEHVNPAAALGNVWLGMMGSLVAYIKGYDQKQIVVLFAAGIFLGGICLVAELLLRGSFQKAQYYFAMQQYLLYMANMKNEKEEKKEKYSRQQRKEPAVPAAKPVLPGKEEWQTAAAKEPEEVLKKPEMKIQTAEKPEKARIDSELLEELLRALLVE